MPRQRNEDKGNAEKNRIADTAPGEMPQRGVKQLITDETQAFDGAQPFLAGDQAFEKAAWHGCKCSNRVCRSGVRATPVPCARFRSGQRTDTNHDISPPGCELRAH